MGSFSISAEKLPMGVEITYTYYNVRSFETYSMKIAFHIWGAHITLNWKVSMRSFYLVLNLDIL